MNRFVVEHYSNAQAFEEGLNEMSQEGYRLNSWQVRSIPTATYWILAIYERV